MLSYEIPYLILVDIILLPDMHVHVLSIDKHTVANKLIDSLVHSVYILLDFITSSC
jgi:hypothetical protein